MIEYVPSLHFIHELPVYMTAQSKIMKMNVRSVHFLVPIDVIMIYQMRIVGMEREARF